MLVSSIDPADPAWPPGLDELHRHAPRALRFRGVLPPPGSLGVAIVGTRQPSPEGLTIARRWAAELAAAGVVIWSGGALGIDAAAHEGALDAGGATVAVIGSGLGQPFPPENGDLFGRIAGSGRGAVVSSLPDGEPARTFHFLNRNAVVAACTRALVVVEAGVTSGSRNAAAHARRLGRPVAVVPFTPGSELGAGNALELTDLRGWPVFSARHVMWLAQRGTTTRPREPKDGAPADAAPLVASPEPTDPLEREVLALVRRAPLHTDAICAATGRGAPQIGRTLFALAVEGLVAERSPGVWGGS